MLYWGHGIRFIDLPFDFGTPDNVALTSTVFVCLIILEVGNNLFCCRHLLDKIYILLN